ncbi:transcriptional regulator [Vibrio astriarenae]|nr:transcriptional regulator [Vibrio sp. C7]
MDLTGRLLLFLDLVERGSYAKAAQLREIDRSVVSKQIRKLEGELGVRLLNRTTRSFSLTDAGQAVVIRAKVLRESLVETIETANRFHERPTGHLKIASISPIARTILQPVIKTFMQNYPEVIIELRLDNRIVDIVGEGFDLAFRASDLQDSNLIARTIAPMRMLLVAAPTFLAKHGIPKTVDELAALPAGGYVVDNYRESHINYLITTEKHNSLN